MARKKRTPNAARAEVLSALLGLAWESGSEGNVRLNQPAQFTDDDPDTGGGRRAYLGGETFHPYDARVNSTDKVLLVMRRFPDPDTDEQELVVEEIERMFECFDGLREYITVVEDSADDEDMEAARKVADRLEREAHQAEMARQHNEDPSYGSW